MLVVLGVFGLCGVVALGVLARRYGALLEARARNGPAAPARSEAEAERRVGAFVAARERLTDEFGRSRGRPASEVQERLERVLEHALESERLERTESERIGSMIRDWEREGTPPSAPYLAPLARRRGYLRRLGNDEPALRSP